MLCQMRPWRTGPARSPRAPGDPMRAMCLKPSRPGGLPSSSPGARSGRCLRCWATRARRCAPRRPQTGASPGRTARRRPRRQRPAPDQGRGRGRGWGPAQRRAAAARSGSRRWWRWRRARSATGACTSASFGRCRPCCGRGARFPSCWLGLAEASCKLCHQCCGRCAASRCCLLYAYGRLQSSLSNLS
jgi:hypothetical protein